MPKISLSQAYLERDEDRQILCQSCRATAVGDGPYCASCKDYWENDAPALYDWEEE